jgi:group I intron endonuclease
VGQTIRKDIETRWKDHKAVDKNTIGRCLFNTYKKYGIDKFKFQIICICFDEDCNQYEEDYIKKYNTIAPNGYNLASGGNNSKCHPETKRLISEKLKGRLLVPITDEIRRKQSLARMGEKNHNFGKKITEERKDKLSKSIKKIWQERRDNNTFDSYIEKILENNKGGIVKKGRISVNRKAVGKYNENGNLLETFTSTVEAGLKMGIHSSNIAKVCRGTKSYKTAAGFYWKFL